MLNLTPVRLFHSALCFFLSFPVTTKTFIITRNKVAIFKILDAIRVNNLVERVTSSPFNLESVYVIYRGCCSVVKLLFALFFSNDKSAYPAPLYFKIQSTSRQLNRRNVFLFYLCVQLYQQRPSEVD